MTDFIIIAVIALVVGGAGLYIYRAKKRGVKCIGCAAAQNGTCGGSCNGTCGCNSR